MNDRLPHPAPSSAASGQIPVELYAGPLCGQAMMLPAGDDAVQVTHQPTGERYTYIASDLRSRKGCRVFQMQPEIPF